MLSPNSNTTNDDGNVEYKGEAKSDGENVPKNDIAVIFAEPDIKVTYVVILFTMIYIFSLFIDSFIMKKELF